MATTAQTTQPIADFQTFLLDHGFITKEQAAELKKIKSARFGDKLIPNPSQVAELLVEAKMAKEEDVAKARAAFLNLPYVDLHKVQITQQVLDYIPEESRNFYHMVSYELLGKDLKVALSDPTNIQALEALEFLGQKLGYQVHIYLASEDSIANAIKGKNIKTVVGEALEDIEQEEALRKGYTAVPEKKTTAPQVIEDAPIIKIVDVILTNAVEGGASDVHIEPTENDVRVRYRIDGILHTSLRLPRNVMSAITSRVKILANLKIDETRLPQDGRFHFESGSKSVDLRVSTLPIMNGEKIVLRLLDKTTSVPTLEQLGLSGKGLKWVKESIMKTHGVFLITGTTGSGKSTTLYSLLTMRNSNEVNIVTLEDPVEYFIEGINQSQIKPEIGLTFASGLRSILRQDPNVIMVGEIRDQETAGLAVNAALTGHLVFSTLHTNNAVGAIPRLIDMGIEEFLLSSTITLIMAQRLVRKLCDNCKKAVEPNELAKKDITDTIVGVPEDYLDKVDLKKMKVYEPVGCAECGNIGYRGRIGIFEVFPLLDEIQPLLYSRTSAVKVYEAALKQGIISMKQDGYVKALQGITTVEEINRVTTE